MSLLGGQTVTVRNFTSNSRDRFNMPVKTPVDTVVSGVSMQPVSTSETVTLTDVATDLWKCFLPPVAAALAATTVSQILYNGAVFEVLGARPGVDFAGNTDHVLLDLKRQIA